MSDSGDLRSFLQARLGSAGTELDKLDPEILLAQSMDIVVESLLYGNIPSEVEVDWASGTRSTVREVKGTRRDPFDGRTYSIPASALTIRFPIHGDGDLFGYRASTFSISSSAPKVSANEIVLTVEAERLTPEMVAGAVEQLRKEVDQRAAWLNADLRAFRVEAAINLRSHAERRKQRILDDRALDQALAIPVRTTGLNRPTVPAIPKQVSLQTRREQATFAPEPMLAEEIYQDILAQVRSWAITLERTPRTAAKLDEEELRDLLLGTLNSFWAGAAGGELFNGSGKTDVLVRENNRNAFIAECKIWRGPASASSAIDQLLGYMVWRDSKAALIMFIRTADPSATIAKLVERVEAHSGFVMTKKVDPDRNLFEYLFTADDEGRTVSVAVIPVVLRSAES